MIRAILLALAVILLLVGLIVTFVEWSSGAQPWGQLLGDNFMFARTLPFTIGLGIALGYWKASGAPLGTQRRASDGAIRRFATSTVWLHALAGVSVIALIGTGGWQYLKGLLAAETPIYMGTVYRIHYFARVAADLRHRCLHHRLVDAWRTRAYGWQRPINSHAARPGARASQTSRHIGGLRTRTRSTPACSANRAVHVLRAVGLVPAL